MITGPENPSNRLPSPSRRGFADPFFGNVRSFLKDPFAIAPALSSAGLVLYDAVNMGVNFAANNPDVAGYHGSFLLFADMPYAIAAYINSRYSKRAPFPLRLANFTVFGTAMLGNIAMRAGDLPTYALGLSLCLTATVVELSLIPAWYLNKSINMDVEPKA